MFFVRSEKALSGVLCRGCGFLRKLRAVSRLQDPSGCVRGVGSCKLGLDGGASRGSRGRNPTVNRIYVFLAPFCLAPGSDGPGSQPIYLPQIPFGLDSRVLVTVFTVNRALWNWSGSGRFG